MNDPQIIIGHSPLIPTSIVQELRRELSDADLTVNSKELDGGPYACYEWLMPSALAVFVAKPFYDELSKRMAEDFADSVYPGFKAAILKAANSARSLAISVFTTAKHKVSDPSSILFCVYSVTRDGQRLKFLFDSELPIESTKCAIDSMFELMARHHVSEVCDELSQQIASLSNPTVSTVLLRFDTKTTKWRVFDWLQETETG